MHRFRIVLGVFAAAFAGSAAVPGQPSAEAMRADMAVIGAVSAAFSERGLSLDSSDMLAGLASGLRGFTKGSETGAPKAGVGIGEAGLLGVAAVTSQAAAGADFRFVSGIVSPRPAKGLPGGVSLILAAAAIGFAIRRRARTVPAFPRNPVFL